MKRVAKPVFFIVLAVILAFTGIVFFGVHTQYGDFTTTIIRGVSDIRWGIDIRGGVDVTFTSPADYDATNEEVDAAKSIVETRLVANNITDYEVYVDYNSDKIIVRFPWQAEDDSFDPEAAVKELGATALLTFREGSEKSLSDGQTYEDLPLIISGSDVEKASAVYQLKSGNSKEYEYMVSLKLKDSGKEKFAEAGIEYFYTLIDDVIARVIRSEGGFIWACKNYDGDVMSDMVSTAFGSLAMMTSVLVSPDGKYEFEAAHGTVTRHYYKYLKGEMTSTNPMATIFAWSGAFKKRGELDNLPELVKFGEALEAASLQTLNDGIMTKDLCGLAEGITPTAVDSEGFIKAIRERLEAKLA